jgi:Prenyltransferase and squalene oxidase repeat
MASDESAKIDLSIIKAIDFLYRSQLPYGEFKIYASPNKDLEGCSFESSPSVAAFVLYSTQFVDHPKVAEMKRKALNFLVEEMEAPGVWRFWSSRSQVRIDPDLDDTCYISFVLREHHPHILFGSNIQIILDNRNEQGLFYTWIRDRRAKNDVDSVLNANVLFYLGEREETQAACDYLNHIILTNQEEGSYLYYVGHCSLYYAMSRAFYNGVFSLGKSRDAIIDKITSRQQPDGSFGDDLNTAYAVCTLLNFRHCDNILLHRAVHRLLGQQMESGAWSKVAAAIGPPPWVWWGSEELTTAVSIEALARYHLLINSE